MPRAAGRVGGLVLLAGDVQRGPVRPRLDGAGAGQWWRSVPGIVGVPSALIREQA
ncbi:hypothetical protein [Actinomadura rubrisoli]|uniref:hypothetical protein n=1 Tax=Actinomadura rubrisoli TaxID=2530368 RepID=UPI0014049ED5|nr:hypothetical protein [Actinomadura rubrisoli]